LRRTIQPVEDASFGQVVWGHFQLDPIAACQSNEMLSHFPGNMRKNLVLALVQLDPEHGSGKDGDDGAFNFDRVRCGHFSIK
jgi:hypothetical protein